MTLELRFYWLILQIVLYAKIWGSDATSITKRKMPDKCLITEVQKMVATMGLG